MIDQYESNISSLKPPSPRSLSDHPVTHKCAHFFDYYICWKPHNIIPQNRLNWLTHFKRTKRNTERQTMRQENVPIDRQKATGTLNSIWTQLTHFLTISRIRRRSPRYLLSDIDHRRSLCSGDFNSLLYSKAYIPHLENKFLFKSIGLIKFLHFSLQICSFFTFVSHVQPINGHYNQKMFRVTLLETGITNPSVKTDFI